MSSDRVLTRKKRLRPSDASATDRVQYENQSQESHSHKKPRRTAASIAQRENMRSKNDSEFSIGILQKEHVSKEQALRASSSGENKRKQMPYSSFIAVNRGIPRQTIDRKWEPLPSVAIDRISQVLGGVERAVVMRLQDERKRTQAGTAVQMVIRKLHRKIVRGLPFPPGTRPQRDEDFDFEKILDSTRTLETALTPTLHSIDLLTEEIKKEKTLLNEETAALEKLKDNAKAEDVRRKQDAKKIHPLLQPKIFSTKPEESMKAFNIISQDQGRSFETMNTDFKTASVFNDLNGHMITMEGNMSQVGGIIPAVETGKSLLRDVLFKYIDAETFEQVIMG